MFPYKMVVVILKKMQETDLFFHINFFPCCQRNRLLNFLQLSFQFGFRHFISSDWAIRKFWRQTYAHASVNI